jgi:hypothetical protein
MSKQDPTCNNKGYIFSSTLEELQQLARFTPVHNKNPYIKQWQKNPNSIRFCENEIKRGKISEKSQKSPIIAYFRTIRSKCTLNPVNVHKASYGNNRSGAVVSYEKGGC